MAISPGHSLGGKKAASAQERQVAVKSRLRDGEQEGGAAAVRKFLRGRARIPTALLLGPRCGKLADLHAPDEAALDEIDVLHHLVLDNMSGPISDDLMHVDHGAARRMRLDAHRL